MAGKWIPAISYIVRRAALGYGYWTMNLTQLTLAQFKQITRLLKDKEACLAKLAAIDQELAAIEAETPSKPARARRTTSGAAAGEPSAERTRRGELKDKIVAALKEAGPIGITVKEIATKLGVNSVNIHAWFANTGKKLTQIHNSGGRRIWVDEMKDPA